ncbi:MAG: hypothetical protein K0Q55_2172 [Verrucomicrobia bacterium]|jgi:hypothetical protein|nr:hypothetical protein [Verrucomicrobiota bacterium]
MGLPTYNCSEDLPEAVPATLSPHGIRVTSRSVPGCRHAYRFRQGLGTVDFGGFVEKQGEPYTFHLVCSSNPLFWFFDMRLLSRVERILLSQGASHWNPPDEN